MKKEFRVHIYSDGENNGNILKMIGNHNAGKVNINVETIAAYLDAKVAIYPNDKGKTVYTLSKDIDTLDISEDNFKTFTLQIKEVEIFELDENI